MSNKHGAGVLMSASEAALRRKRHKHHDAKYPTEENEEKEQRRERTTTCDWSSGTCILEGILEELEHTFMKGMNV